MTTKDNFDKDISIVIPLFNEAESLPELAGWIRSVMEREGFVYEIMAAMTAHGMR